MEIPEITEALDQMELGLVKKLDCYVRGYWDSNAATSAEKCGRILVNIAMYRRLRAGDKMRVRPDGTADIAATMP